MPANFGILPELDIRVHNKRERYKEYRDRALRQIKMLRETLLDKSSSPTNI